MKRETLIARLKDIVGEENVLFSEMDLTLYGYDASMERGRPDAVVLPGSTEEVSPVQQKKWPRSWRWPMRTRFPFLAGDQGLI
jgi:hypothetical protein